MIFRAEGEILLNPGFETMPDKKFMAYFTPCYQINLFTPEAKTIYNLVEGEIVFDMKRKLTDQKDNDRFIVFPSPNNGEFTIAYNL